MSALQIILALPLGVVVLAALAYSDTLEAAAVRDARKREAAQRNARGRRR